MCEYPGWASKPHGWGFSPVFPMSRHTILLSSILIASAVSYCWNMGQVSACMRRRHNVGADTPVVDNEVNLWGYHHGLPHLLPQLWWCLRASSSLYRNTLFVWHWLGMPVINLLREWQVYEPCLRHKGCGRYRADDRLTDTSRGCIYHQLPIAVMVEHDTTRLPAPWVCRPLPADRRG